MAMMGQLMKPRKTEITGEITVLSAGPLGWLTSASFVFCLFGGSPKLSEV